MAAPRAWRMKLSTGALGGNNISWVSVDPMRAVIAVWLVANNGTLWQMGIAGDVEQVDGAPSNLRVVAVDGLNVLAIDGDSRLWSASSGNWEQRKSPGGLADPFVSVTGDGRGRGWLTTREGRVFVTKDGGANFQPDTSGFGPGGPDAVMAMKACFTDRPGPTRWFLDTLRRIWRRGEFDLTPTVLQSVPDSVVRDISVGPDGLLWIVMPRFGIVRALTTDGISSPVLTEGSEDIFTVAPGIDGKAWACKSDGTLWEFVEV